MRPSKLLTTPNMVSSVAFFLRTSTLVTRSPQKLMSGTWQLTRILQTATTRALVDLRTLGLVEILVRRRSIATLSQRQWFGILTELKFAFYLKIIKFNFNLVCLLLLRTTSLKWRSLFVTFDSELLSLKLLLRRHFAAYSDWFWIRLPGQILICMLD